MDARVETNVEPAREEPWPLPEGWCWAKLSDATDKVDNVDPKEKFGKNEFRYIDLGAIHNGKITAAQYLSGENAPSRARQAVKFGDTILSCVRVYLKNIAIVGRNIESPVASTAFCVLRPNKVIDSKYLNYFVQSERFIGWLIPLQRGNSPPAVVDSDVKGQLIPLAPLDEQRRIVARLDACFAEIAEGEAALAAARKGLDTFRRALLKAAVTGELTKDWRETNTVTETGHDLLARIAKSRTQHAQLKGRGRRATEAQPIETAALPKLPPDWAWGALGNIAEIVGGATVDKKRKPTDPVTVPYLRVANVQRGHVDLSEIKSITVERVSAEKLSLKAGDLLLNEGGDRDKIGRGWVWEGAIPEMIHQNHVFRARLCDDGLNPFFVSHYANEMGRRFFIDEGKQTTNLASISLSKISLLPVPIPPPAEAAEILRRVSAALAASADTLALLEAEAADAARLKQSVLKAAFEGRLVPQDPTDEPASALLARLRAEGAAQGRATSGRRRRS